MEPRAIRDLAQLPDDKFFQEVAKGLDLVFENASAMEADAQRLIAEKAWRGARVLRAIADEEASKYLILLDAVRCPRSTNDEKKMFDRQLGYFNKHLPKGIYAEYCYIQPNDFKEAKRYVELCRPELYLDGPEYVLWTFRNQILQKREDRIYVDYVRSDEGRGWTTPAYELSILEEAGEPLYSGSLRLAGALQKLGFAKADALAIIAQVWRPVEITDDFDIFKLSELTERTLQALADKSLLVNDERAIQIAIDRWLFPLYSLDLNPLPVDRKALREEQQAEADRFYEQF